MNMLETRPAKPGDEPTRKPINFMFFEDIIVVGHIAADCCVCAWNEGCLKWPKADMAVVITPLEFGRDEFDVPDRCMIESNHLRREAINRP